ncbi:hypothetical protein HW450_05485 [Corynebacterium hindlerae]|uniref:DUF6286 domain-containing protein n=1 Tax=Corynebacterium hindlerae TaxID=699041 RepID=A0A7G5FHS6_9CORY|nr:DUF6286 domain-containing protein [Corynebacterium hindlerae]QMV86167.1 hypothetical protein HW450_05485 [Corynebacterium hindlerae]
MTTRVPRATPASRIVAILMSLSLFGVAICAARELWTKRTGTQLNSLLTPVFELIARAKYEPWMLPMGCLVVAVGFALIVIALKPRPRTHIQLRMAENHWTRNVDIARLCTAAAERVPGVARASTYASPRHVTVTISGNHSDSTLVERVTSTVHNVVAPLADAPQVQVRLQQQPGENQ